MHNIQNNTINENRHPIFLTKYDPLWQQDFANQKTRLDNLLKNHICRISHIGSTSIKNIWARPTIDILVEANPDTNLDDIKAILDKNNYVFLGRTQHALVYYHFINTQDLQISYMIYVKYLGDNDELYFRDYLENHDNVAWEYDKLRLSLWKKYTYNRKSYKAAKSEFITKYTNIAKQLYKDKYIN